MNIHPEDRERLRQLRIDQWREIQRADEETKSGVLHFLWGYLAVSEDKATPLDAGVALDKIAECIEARRAA